MPTESAFPKLDIPNIDLWAFLFEREDNSYPDDKVIYIDPDTSRSYTFAQTRSTACNFGKGLKSQWDWQKGDVLALYTLNCIDTPAIIWGTHWTGGIISPANPDYTSDELVFQLKDAGAKALVTQKPFLKVAYEAAKRVGISEERIIVIGDERDEAGKFKHFTDIKDTSVMMNCKRTKVDPKKDLAFLVYSSGTTGHPKGVMLSHENIVANIMMLTVGEGGKELSWKGGKDGSGDKILAFLPFFHIYGLTCLIHQSIYRGLQLIVMSKFDLEPFCRHIQDYSITVVYVVPPVVLMLGKSPIVDKYDLSSVRMMSSGAAPLTHDLVETVYKRLKIPIKQGYGLSETSPATHTQSWDEWHTTSGSVGRLLPNQVAKYMSAEGKEVPVGEIGELWLKGPNIFLGYLNNPESTHGAKTEDGYFKTGDVGYQDENGNFYITDRIKELIKYKGFQVPPAELEGLLSTHHEIDDVAVIGVYDKDQATEVPRAYVVPKKDMKADNEMEKRVTTWLMNKVANHKRLRGGIRFINQIPKSASGKILRRVLKEQAAAEDKTRKAKL